MNSHFDKIEHRHTQIIARKNDGKIIFRTFGQHHDGHRIRPISTGLIILLRMNYILR